MSTLSFSQPDEFESSTPDGLLLQRLVDGELDESTRGQFLLRLDSEPDGWRRCALAFLENDALCRALRPLGTIEPVDSRTAQREPLRPRAAWVPWLAWAATLLLAFFGGWSWSQKPRENRASPQITEAISVDPQPETPAKSLTVDARETSHDSGELPRHAPVTTHESSALLSLAQRELLERKGFAVEQRAGFASFPLGEGRRLALPVSEVKLRYVGLRTY